MTNHTLSAEELGLERAEFEAVLCDRYGYTPASIVSRRAGVGYNDPSLCMALVMWQARAALARQPQPECGEVFDAEAIHFQWVNGEIEAGTVIRALYAARRLLAERGDAIKEWSALAIQRGEERDILQKKLDRFYSQSHGIPALTEIEKLRARVAELEKMLGACLTYATRMEPMSAKLMNAIDAALTQLSGRKEEEHEKA